MAPPRGQGLRFWQEYAAKKAWAASIRPALRMCGCGRGGRGGPALGGGSERFVIERSEGRTSARSAPWRLLLPVSGRLRRRRRSRPHATTSITATNISPKATTARPARAWSTTANRCRAAAGNISSAIPITSPDAPITRTRTSITSPSAWRPGTATRSTAARPPTAKSTTSARCRRRIRPCRCRAMRASPISANGYSVIVRVNDRGPYAAGRVMDVSSRVADVLDFKRMGTAQVKVEYVGRAPMEGSDDNELLATLRTDGGAANLGGGEHGRRGRLAAAVAVRLAAHAPPPPPPPPPPEPPPPSHRRARPPAPPRAAASAPPRAGAGRRDRGVADAERDPVAPRAAKFAPLPPGQALRSWRVREASFVPKPPQRPSGPAGRSISTIPDRSAQTRSPNSAANECAFDARRGQLRRRARIDAALVVMAGLVWGSVCQAAFLALRFVVGGTSSWGARRRGRRSSQCDPAGEKSEALGSSPTFA